MYVKNSRLWHDLSTSVDDNVLPPFHEGFIFAKCRRGFYFREASRKRSFVRMKTLAKISEFPVGCEERISSDKACNLPKRDVRIILLK